jgi:hypothetical protein
MIIKSEKTGTVVDSSLQTNKVTAKEENLRFIIKSLTSNLYSDPIGSVVREYFSNCVDSVTRANTQEKIQINWIEGNLISGNSSAIQFIDYGTGLTKQQMKDIYLSIGESDKRNSSSEIGGFGLGSKSFVAYSNSMVVTSVRDGRICKFMIYKDDEGDLAYNEIMDQETSERNQTIVEIPARSGDKSKFFDAIERQLLFFDNFTIKGFSEELPPVEILDEDNNYVILKGESTSYILLGKVRYEINLDNITGINRVNSAGIGLKFKIGELQPTPSRESIKLDEKSKVLIKAKFEEIKKALTTKVEKELETFNYFENAIASYSKRGRIYNSYIYSIVSPRYVYKTEVNGAPFNLSLGKAFDTDFISGEISLVTKGDSDRRRWGRRKPATKTPDYRIEKISYYSDLNSNLPVYQIESGTTNTKKNIFLLNQHKDGFYIIRKRELQPDAPIFSKTEGFLRVCCFLEFIDKLPKYENVVVPETEKIVTSYEVNAEIAKERKQERKLTGKFACKKAYAKDTWRRVTVAFSNSEYKYEDFNENNFVIYGSTEEGVALENLYSDLYDILKNVNCFKVSKEVIKNVKDNPGFIHYSKVLQMQSPLNQKIADYATHIKLEVPLKQYNKALYFRPINKSVQNDYCSVKNLGNRFSYIREDFGKEVLDLCEKCGNLNYEIIDAFNRVEEYFKGAEILRWVDVNSDSIPFIQNYLLEKGKEIDLVEIEECVSNN